MNSKYLQAEANAGRLNHRLIVAVTASAQRTGKEYRPGNASDVDAFREASSALATVRKDSKTAVVPDEPLKPWSGVFNAPLFGMTTWGALFNDRQALAISTFIKHLKAQNAELTEVAGGDYA